MKQRSAAILFLLLCGLFTYGLMRLFQVQFAAGDVYPEYSTLRTDPGGSKLLYDSLAAAGLPVSRNFEPLDTLDETGASILLLNIAPTQFLMPDGAFCKTLEQLAARGNRIVASMNSSAVPGNPKPLADRWQVRLNVDSEKGHVHRLYFDEAREWQTLDRAGAKLLAIQRAFGAGSIVLISESEDFNNQSTAAMDRLPLITAAIGANRKVIFDEEHLGISESGSVVAIGRRFRLGGMALGLAICTALFLWRNTSSFPPAEVSTPAMPPPLAGRTSLSGLITLLRRHVPPPELAAACWREWLASNRREVPAERIGRAERVLHGGGSRPVETIRELDAILRGKGSL